MFKTLLFSRWTVGIVGFALLMVLVSTVALWRLARQSQQTRGETGIVHGKLRPPPETPNCAVAVISADDGGVTFRKLVEFASSMPGCTVVETNERYFHAEFRSWWFGFVDDLEMLHHPDESSVQIRSASRVGHSDLGANQARIDRLLSAGRHQR